MRSAQEKREIRLRTTEEILTSSTSITLIMPRVTSMTLNTILQRVFAELIIEMIKGNFFELCNYFTTTEIKC